MIISLLGMSGAGKSYWTKKLEHEGFRSVSADELIEAKLEEELTPLGYKGINGLGKWMGHPFEDRYERTSRTYLGFEKDVMNDILTQISQYPDSDNFIVDTTGSVIYMPDEILNELSLRTTMVYFHTPESAHEAMARQFFTDPKPLIWGSSFSQSEGESQEQALARCYPELLLDRTARYQKLAHVTLGYDQLRSSDMTAKVIVDRAADATKVTHG
jgi:shikimate kinase